jgi:hypothetical protein
MEEEFFRPKLQVPPSVVESTCVNWKYVSIGLICVFVVLIIIYAVYKYKPVINNDSTKSTTMSKPPLTNAKPSQGNPNNVTDSSVTQGNGTNVVDKKKIIETTREEVISEVYNNTKQ